MKYTFIAFSVVSMLLTGCATTSPIQRFTESKSAFGRDPILMSHRVPADQIYRIYERAATGFVSIEALRESTEQRAQQFCERQGKGMLVLGEQISSPPYILGNFPRIEIVFAVVEKFGGAARDEQYMKLSNLKKLLDEGAITKDEFEYQKAKILGRY